ncbi:hypothetical protein F4677DRAFT_252108 [Hypoxylon crocopeplum]|nr:hypothetical protein F4677DRAFT_252108 [Hypoxylon crocopeplum]
MLLLIGLVYPTTELDCLAVPSISNRWDDSCLSSNHTHGSNPNLVTNFQLRRKSTCLLPSKKPSCVCPASTWPPHSWLAPSPRLSQADNKSAPTYSVIAYSIGKDAKRSDFPAGLSPRIAEEALAKRDEANTGGAEYSLLVYAIGKEEEGEKKRAAISPGVPVSVVERDEYSIVAYSIGKEGEEEKREVIPEQAYARMLEDVDAVVKRGEEGTDGAEYSLLLYSIGKERKREEEYSIIAYSIGKE